MRFSNVNGNPTLLIEPGLTIFATLKKPALRILKDYLRSNVYRIIEINSDTISISLFEFFYVFGKYLESDDKFNELFFSVNLIMENEIRQ